MYRALRRFQLASLRPEVLFVCRQLGLSRQGDLMALLAAWPGLAPAPGRVPR